MSKINQAILAVLCVLLISGFLSCNRRPQPIKSGEDECSFCKMSIVENHFGAEIITKKGKIYKFDDMHCLVEFLKSGSNQQDAKEIWLINFEEPHNFIPSQNAFLLKSSELHSPMGGNVAAFEDESKLKRVMEKIEGEKTILVWAEMIKQKE